MLNKNRVIVMLAAVAALVAVLLVVRHADYGKAGGQRPNVLLITLDTTRADRLGCYGYADALTPALDELAAKGVLFEQAFCNVPLTLPSHATILTGLHPPEHGIRINGKRKLNATIATLPKAFREAGYQTGAFIAAFALDSQFGLDQGFDTYDDDLSGAYEQVVKEPDSQYRPGNLVTDSALKWLEGLTEGPFFCWVHLYDPHMAYFSHPELSGTRFSQEQSYDAEVAFMDMQVGRLMAFLEERGQAARTLVVAVGDHGEGLDDHKEEQHGYMVYATTLQVPVIVSLPGKVREGHRVNALVSLTDVMPTILDFVGIENPSGGSGRSLVAALLGDPIDSLPCYGETDLPYTSFGWCPLRSLTTPEWKYVRTARVELYDRRTDPKELKNLASQQPEMVEELEETLAIIEDEMISHKAEDVALDDEGKRNLEALGYLSGGGDPDDEVLDYGSLKDIKDMVDALNMLWQVIGLLHQGKPSEAGAVAEKITGLDPPFAARVQHRLGSDLATQGKVEEAIEHFSAALRLDPGLSEAREQLGLLLVRTEQWARAEEHFRRLVALKPGSAAGHLQLGTALQKQGKLDEAIIELRESLRLDPANKEAQGSLAGALFATGRTREAEALLREALDADPNQVPLLRLLGMLLVTRQSWAEAEIWFGHLLKLDAGLWSDHFVFGTALAQLGKESEAVAAFNKAIAMDKNWQGACIKVASVWISRGRYDRAVETLRAGLKSRPGDVNIKNSLAWLLATCPNAELRNGAEALRLAQEANARANSGDPRVLDTLAAAYAEAGQFQEAVSAAKKALAAARGKGTEKLAVNIEKRLALYNQGKAYHEPSEEK